MAGIDGIDFLQLDMPAILLAVLAAVACAIPGNFLVLRRQSLLGDAISHVVLPGIVIGFLLSGTTSTWPMLLGAGAAAIVAVALIELVRRLSGLESGAVMGIVFTSMFAAGVLILERSEARNVHIDVQHALYGNIEGTVWLEPASIRDLLDPAILATMPGEIARLFVVVLVIAVLVVAFFKELRITTFDPGLAATLGFSPGLVSAGLVLLAALAAVAAFDAVGSILVIAMFVCPPAIARHLTDHLAMQVILSVATAVFAALSGYVLAAFVPLWLGYGHAFNVAGAMAVTAGLMLAVVMLFAPRYGWLARCLAGSRSAGVAGSPGTVAD
ncbi:MAG: metal ABC transporter permease [Geminicoccaceae bacterium]